MADNLSNNFSEHDGIDNVRLQSAPEPGVLALLVLSGAALLRRRR
jgi:uncharacterized protein (TIGR03382 family)